MKLFTFPIAPNPTKVRLYIAEKKEQGIDIPLDFVEVSLPEGEHRSEEFLARNPFGALPVLEMDDGANLHESLAIIEYLEERFPGGTLFGANPEERAFVRAIERTLDIGALMNLGMQVHATNSPTGRPPNPPLAEYAAQRAKNLFSHIEGHLGDGRAFVCGNDPTIADCTLAAAIQFARFGKVDPSGDYPNILNWYEAYKVRPPVAEILML